MPSKPRRASPEGDLQRAILRMLKVITRPQTLWFSVPNEGRRSTVMAGKLKAQGLTPGVSDLIIISPEGIAFFMEVKAPGGSLSDLQRLFRDKVHAATLRAGHWVVVKSVEQALEAVRAWRLVRQPTERDSTDPRRVGFWVAADGEDAT